MRTARRQRLGAMLAALLVVLPAAVPAQPAGPRIGYVDMKRLLDQAPQVLAARQQLEREFAARDTALGRDETRLAALRDALERDRRGLPDEDVARRQQEIDTLAGSVRRARDRMQDELRNRSAQELDRSWQAISNAAVEYARSHDFDLVLPSPVIYASPAIDITDAVLDELRQQRKQARP